MSIHNPQNLIGMGSILADEGDTFDVDAFEQQITSGGKVQEKKTTDLSKDFSRVLNDLDRIANDVDISDAESVSSESSAEPWNLTPKDSQLANMTVDAKKTVHINNVLSDINVDDRDATFINEETEDDELCQILEKIDMLRTNLEHEDVDLSRIPEVNHNTTKREAKSILRILQIKNDRARYCDLFEEGMLGLAIGLENIFDGKNEVLGSKIDLTGYSDTVKVKLRRMRYETSSFIGGIMEGSNLSPGMRILLELVPSLLLYTRNRRITSNDTLVTESDYKNAMQQM